MALTCIDETSVSGGVLDLEVFEVFKELILSTL
jgi:hypothetical protein